MTRFVYCSTMFEGFHKWSKAPEGVSYLRNIHRHMFHVKVFVKVLHNDRAVEFITLKHYVDAIIKLRQPLNIEISCEQIAEDIYQGLKEIAILASSISVSEDGENGAMIVWDEN